MERNIIFVDNYETDCSIGIYPKEKEKKQKIKISVKLEFLRAYNSDKLSSTLSYESILDYLKKIKTFEHINLVETLANKICNNFLSYKKIIFIEVKIVKCKLVKKNTDVGFLLKKSLKNK